MSGRAAARPHRLACLAVPLFPLAARLRSEPELLPRPLALVEGNGTAARVVAATRPARQAGLRPGVTVAQAKALIPELVTRGRDPQIEQAAQQALFEVALTFSPRVESALIGGGPSGAPLSDAPDPGVVILDVHGLERHFAGRAGTSLQGSPDSSGERELGRALVLGAAGVGLPARAGLASTKLAAFIAASLPDTPTLVPPGADASFLAPLPLQTLLTATRREGLPETSALPELFVALERWGLRTIGELARLPPAAVASRLGDAGYRLHRLACGLDARPLVPRRLPIVFEEGMDLEWTLATLEAFLGVAGEALGRLTERLAAQGLGCGRLRLTLRLGDDEAAVAGLSGEDVRAFQLPSPTREAATLLTLVRHELDARPPGAPVTGFTFSAQPDRPRRGQLTLFGPPELSPDRLATVLARLAALVGDERYGSPATVDAHPPELHGLGPYDPPPPPRWPRPVRPNHRLLAVRVLRPPVELEVLEAPEVLEVLEGPAPSGQRFRVLQGGRAPARPEPPPAPRPPPVRQRGNMIMIGGPFGAPHAPLFRLLSVRALGRGAPPISGRVRQAVGPWQLEGAWWGGAPPSRDYWDVELASGSYRIFRERWSGSWFADGVYD